jgi:hypothetical protein
VKVRIGIGSLPTESGRAAVGTGFDELVDALEERDVDSLWLPDLVSTDAVDALVGLACAPGRPRPRSR